MAQTKHIVQYINKSVIMICYEGDIMPAVFANKFTNGIGPVKKSLPLKNKTATKIIVKKKR